MVDNKTFTKWALAFPEAEQAPHFEKTSFRVKKKIFATLDIKNSVAVVKLSEIDQSVFSSGTTAIYPIPNKWGKQGWTKIELKKVRKDTCLDALTTSYCTVAPKSLGKLVRS